MDLSIDEIGLSNTAQAFFNFIKSLIGIAILDLPYAANQGGYILSSFAFIFISYGTIRTTTFLIDMADKTDYHKYSKIVKYVQGPFQATIVDITIIGQQLFTCIAYIIFFQLTSVRALTNLHINLNSLVSPLMSLLIIIPLSLIRDIYFFHSTSTIGFLLAIFTIISITIIAIQQMGVIDPTPFKFSGLPSFVGVGMFAYEGICTALPVRLSMSNRTGFNSVLISSSLTVLGIYIMFIIINCVAYGDSVRQIIFFNLPETNYTFVLQFIYALSILLTYPVQITPAFEILEKRFTKKSSKYQWIILRLIVTLILFMIAFVIPNFSTFLNLIGVIFGTIIQFWFPITMRLSLKELTAIDKIEAYGLLLFGIGCGIIGLKQAILDIYQQSI